MRVLYVDVDTLRPDHLSCYGYHRRTSPNFDSVAAEGVRFTNFYATDTPCLPSRTALFRGRAGIHTGVVNHGATGADMRPIPTLRGFANRSGPMAGWMTTLRQLGYYTVCASPFAERHAAWDFYDGFREMYNPGKGGMESAEEVVPWAMDWLERHGQEDHWFLHVHVWDPHTPYRAPADYDNPFKDEPPASWITDDLIAGHRQYYGPHSARTPHHTRVPDNAYLDQYPRLPKTIEDLDDYKLWIDGYDTGIHYADHWAGRVFDLLRSLGVWDETLVIVSSDHGENQGELNVYGDHQLADHVTHRIPLIVKGPGIVRAGAVDDGLHYNVDLAPTLVELLGGAEWPELWDGRSFARSLTGGVSCGRDVLVLSHACWSIQRSVRFGPWLLLLTRHDGFKQILRPTMLFNVEEDPHELRDLAADRPEIVRQGRALLQEWLDETLDASLLDDDPHVAVLHGGGPFHAPIWELHEYADDVREIWGDPAAEDLIRRHADEYHRYLMDTRRHAEAAAFMRDQADQ
ncbi:MAG: sulfatase [Phycisphaerae bacterium]|nr:sulfatase [Phycisphaerae bacterium]